MLGSPVMSLKITSTPCVRSHGGSWHARREEERNKDTKDGRNKREMRVIQAYTICAGKRAPKIFMPHLLALFNNANA